MGGATPKQYLPLNGVPILQHTLARLANHPAIRGVIVALSADDSWWPTLTLATFAAPIHRARGGAERYHSVSNALQAAMTPEIGAKEEDWVLVHDAARPCLRQADIDRLITALHDHPVGGLLGNRVRDTMKRTDPEPPGFGGVASVVKTVDRADLWHALTPQMFRLGALSEALTTCAHRGVAVTDEAQAMELQAQASGGPMPRMVAGAGDNLKITTPDDLALAAFCLREQARE
uniref:2-C-methyl-D-erythritol 4-phosphate cytidylyltransferase n=1 Tax=Candidatus Kentrum eta TaxID=2126337 RepID=A0A450V0B0_9GAMM|nr:MAG: 2-C-methyl-D-erythritol 4-phosphate cytidylyltransferase [Candidatus Kentron sp. H]VFJ98405.1 MAG: 2-C-methyl-D-erythritol 4-phosphate cytidylyltransferase [Candidatus Kentron sp. H]VFK03534.1 MAG: 2-C-methyl-D-erythritol 4-phosphate cytidylyltransferase [Candidatus Kentron sp. H]